MERENNQSLFKMMVTRNYLERVKGIFSFQKHKSQQEELKEFSDRKDFRSCGALKTIRK